MTFSGILDALFGTKRRETVTITVDGGTKPSTNYNTPTKTNRELSRQLYHNTNSEYKLAAQLVKPIINNNVNFIGIPKLFGNKKSTKVIDEVNIDYRKIHKTIEIDGDAFIWPQWDDKKKKIKLINIPIDVVNEMFVDPLTKEVTGYRLKEDITYSTANEKGLTTTIEYIITKDVLIRRVTGSIESKTVYKNFLGELPIVHFSNDKDANELYGHAEIENVLPQVKFYHDLTYEAGAAQSRDGHPKMKVTTKNAKTWINNNFGAGAYEQIAAGKTKISMEDRDLFVNQEGDDVSYLYLNKTSGDFSTLAQLAFTNIVEGSETPEINFGANIGTSLASVKEYRPVWIKKIQAKQYERTEPWLQVYELILKIHNFVNIKSLKMDITMVWPKPNFASVKEQSEIVDAFSKAIEKLKAKGIITNEEIYDTLKELDIFILAETFKIHQKVADDEKEDEPERADTDDDSEETSDEGTKTKTEGDTEDGEN